MTLAAAALLTALEYALTTNSELRERALKEGHFPVLFLMPEDEAYWAEQTQYGIVTGADVIRRDAIQCYSDTHKELYSIRPNWINFQELSTERIGEMLTELQNSDVSYDDETDWDRAFEADDDEDMSLTDVEAAEDFRRSLPTHLIQAWGL